MSTVENMARQYQQPKESAKRATHDAIIEAGLEPALHHAIAIRHAMDDHAGRERTRTPFQDIELHGPQGTVRWEKQ